MDIQQEIFTKEKTYFLSFAEIKVCSKISTTNWDDSFNITWETLIIFYKKFNIKWNPIDFLKRKKFNDKQRFLFYNFFPKCLFIHDCRVIVDLERIDI